MFRVKASAANKPRVQWTEDGGSGTLRWRLKDVELKIDVLENGEVELSVDAPREFFFHLWGNIDRRLVREVMAAQFDGRPSDMLEVVRKAMEEDE